MHQLIVGIVCLVIGLLLFLTARLISAEARNFEKKKKLAKAEVDSCRREESSSWYTVYARIPELKDDKIYNCKSKKINPADYPKGSIINVEYAHTKSLGINTVDVHLVDHPPVSSLSVSRGISIVSIVVVCIALYLLFSGIVAIV